MITKEELWKEARELLPEMTDWRRAIHRHPETGLHLPHTAGIVKETLTRMGLGPQDCGTEGCTGVTALIQGERPGPVLLLRADMDALPLTEENDLPYKSEIPGAAHMCGHDTHTAMLLGAAALLVRHRGELCGSVKLMFQPGEEGFNGARHMVEDGLLEAPRPDAAIAMHCLTGSRWKTGTLLTATGLLAKASADAFTVTVRGQGTHGATPEHGTDVIRALSAITQELLSIRSREISAFTPAMLSVCQIHAGNADNALPDSGFLTGTFRTFDEEVQALFRRRIEEIALGTARALGTEADVEFRGSLAPTRNDPVLCGKVTSWIRELAGPEGWDSIGPVTGAEDFSEISRVIPSVYIDLSFGSAEEGYPYAVHSPRCLFNEEAMPFGAACHAWCAMKFLSPDSGAGQA